METPSGPPQQSVSAARTRRLQSLNAKGKDYQRWYDVEAEIQRILHSHESGWIAEAPDLRNESLVFLIRHVREGGREIYGHLLQELMNRIVHMARHWVSGFDEATKDYLLGQIDIEMLKLVLAEKPTRRSDYLEIAFAKALRQLTFNVIRKHSKSPMGRRGEAIPTTDEDDDPEEIERPLDFVPDNGRSPQTLVLQADLIRKIKERVQDPRHFEAALLHWGYGWPITSTDPDRDCLTRYFGVSQRHIKYWLEKVMPVMRAACEAQARQGAALAMELNDDGKAFIR
jgi:hypothetical protein